MMAHVFSLSQRQNNKSTRLYTAAILSALSILTSCGSSSLSSSDIPGVTVTGYVSKGPITGATCTLLGESGESLGTDTSSNGSVKFRNIEYNGTYYSLSCAGGNYTDEATGTNTASAVTLRGVANYNQTKTIVASPFTEVAYQLGEGTGKALFASILEKNALVASRYGIPGVAIHTTIPTDVTTTKASSSDAGKYGVVLAGVSNLQRLNNLTLEEAIQMLVSGEKAQVNFQAAIDGLNNIPNATVQNNIPQSVITEIRNEIGFNVPFSAGHNKIIAEPWDSVSGAADYQICWSTSSTVSSADCASQNYTVSNSGYYAIKDSSIANGTTYYVIAVARDSGGNTLEQTLVVTEVTPADPYEPLNDTGITFAGTYPSGIDTTCASSNDTQDCHSGRDSDTNLSKTGAGHAGFDFTKLDVSGNALTTQNASWSSTGSESAGTKWSCVKDNYTGLTWEIKQSASGEASSQVSPNLHHGDDQFSWYNNDNNSNAGNAGVDNASVDSCYGYQSGNAASYCNTEAYIARVNTEAWCGKTNWRLPSRMELMNIASYDEPNVTVVDVALDKNYFANIIASGTQENSDLWTSSSAATTTQAWYVEFNLGAVLTDNKTNKKHLMLVSD